LGGGGGLGAIGALDGNEAVINTDPHGGGWLFKIRMSNTAELAELMDAAAYEAIAAH
jgi:glycine cleavage system H protein